MIQTQISEKRGPVEYCCCCNQGESAVKFHLEKDGYMPGQMVQMIIEVDNSQCDANIESIRISVTNEVIMRSQGQTTTSHIDVFSKLTTDVPAKMSRMVHLKLISRAKPPSWSPSS